MHLPQATVLCTPRRRGFTLIELLIAIGIIAALTALALPAILLARKRGIETRVRSDLALIGTALEAYRSEFSGQYPAFSTAAEDYSAAQTYTTTTDSSYPWLDYRQNRGAILLCRALIGSGPGPVLADATKTAPAELQGEDGADGPGFRVRRNLSAINGVWTTTGKVYGPYVDASKFKLVKQNSTDPAGSEMIADSSGNPILYYPARQGNPTPTLFYVDPRTYDPTAGKPATGYLSATSPYPRFNGYDNQAFIDSTSGGTTFSTSSQFALLAANCGSLPYLLWTAGIDGHFGYAAGKCDDIANFDVPGK